MKSITDFITEDRDQLLHIRQTINQTLTATDQSVTKSNEFKNMMKDLWEDICKRYDIK